MPKTQSRPWRAAGVYGGIVLVSLLAGSIAAELYLAHRSAPRMALPFYNRLYPYVMFHPYESYIWETRETADMSHRKNRIFVYTNEDGFRVRSAGYKLPKDKPAGQLRIAVLGASQVELASTFETTMPGSLEAVLRRQYPGRDIEVINAGIQSCVSRQSIVELEVTVVDYHPDMVIFYDGGNDLGLPLTYESRPNFPYNFQTMEEAWDLYREEHRAPLWRIALGRSYLYRAIRARLEGGNKRTIPTADDPLAGTNAVSPDRIISDHNFVAGHVAAYLSNWRKLVELSRAYGYRPVCVLIPSSAGLDANYAVPKMVEWFHLDRETAVKWVRAFDVLYDEAGVQIERLRPAYPEATFLNLAHDLTPPEKYFWDLAHIYDEANMIVAERIYREIRPGVESALSYGTGAGRVWRPAAGVDARPTSRPRRRF